MRPLASLSLRLSSGKEEHTAITDSDGHFNFSGLSHKVYVIEADLPGWRFIRTSDDTRKIDLTKAGCSQLFVAMEQLR